jgi:DNA polymerase III alpha subunit (gram-positive type)
VLDTLKMSRAIYGASVKHGLPELIDRLNLERILPEAEGPSKHHNALYDAEAAAQAFVHMAYENFSDGYSLGEMATLCSLEPIASGDNEPGNAESSPEKGPQSNFGWQ